MDDAELLDVVSRAAAYHPVDRAIALAHCALPQLGADEVADVPLGARNRALWAAGAEWLGGLPPAVASCPACGTEQEFPLPAAHPAAAVVPAAETTIEVAGTRVTLRPLTSRDLAAVAHCHEPLALRRALLARCLVAMDGSPPPEDTLAEAADAALTAADPGATLPVRLRCADCDADWVEDLDVAAFLWQLLSARAERVFDDVVMLARAFGWSEDQVLAIPTHRRQRYVERVSE